MSNVIPLHPTRRVSITAHRITFDLVPRDVMERLFNAAIAMGFASGDDMSTYVTGDEHADACLAELLGAVSAASQYTVPVQIEVDEPI